MPQRKNFSIGRPGRSFSLPRGGGGTGTSPKEGGGKTVVTRVKREEDDEGAGTTHKKKKKKKRPVTFRGGKGHKPQDNADWGQEKRRVYAGSAIRNSEEKKSSA